MHIANKKHSSALEATHAINMGTEKLGLATCRGCSGPRVLLTSSQLSKQLVKQIRFGVTHTAKTILWHLDPALWRKINSTRQKHFRLLRRQLVALQVNLKD